MSTKYLKVMPKLVLAELPQTYDVSAEQIKFYHEHGFLLIKELIDFTSLYNYKQRFIQICNGVVDIGNITMVKERGLIGTGAKGEELINKLQEITYDDVFSQYTEHPRLLHVVSQLIPGSAKSVEEVCLTAMHSMFINKPPGSTRHPPHQDLYYFPFRPADQIIAAWTAIDHVHSSNGALYVIPGSHKAGKLYEHGNLQGAMKWYHGILQEETVAPIKDRVELEMAPGDTVFFHPLLVHGSGPNVTKNYRKSISCHYANSECHYIDVSGTAQEQIKQEVLVESARRGFTQVTYEDLWKYKNKQVKGIKSNL